MAEYRPPLFQAMDWFSQRNAQNNQYYKNAPQVGTNMTPYQLRNAMPPMRDSQVDPAIQAMAPPLPQYPPVSGEDIMKQLMAANAAAPAQGTMAEGRNQEIAFANRQPAPGTMPNARMQEIDYANNPQKYAMPQGGGGGPRQGGQMYGPTMADVPNGGQPAYYTMDPGDGGILRTFMSPNGVAPNIPGMTATNMQSVDPNQGALAKFFRGAF